MLHKSKSLRGGASVLLHALLVAMLATSGFTSAVARADDYASGDTSPQTVDVAEEVVAEDDAPAEDNASTEEEPAVEAEAPLVLTDEESGVSVTIPADAMSEGVAREDMALRVSELTDEQIQAGLDRIGKNEDELLKALDISLYNRQTGEEVQPKEGTSVTVINSQIENAEEEIVDVHRLNDDGTVTPMNATVVEAEGTGSEVSAVAFETEHFTEYYYTITTADSNVAYIQKMLDAAKKDSRQLAEGAVTQIKLQDNVYWGENEMLTIPAGLNVEFVNQKGSSITLGRNATRGTMINVEKGATLTIPSGFVMDGNGGEYYGNGSDSSVRGVFVHTEGTLNLDGVEMKNAHAQSSDNNVSLAAPVVSHGGTINMTAGEIHGTWFTANPRNAGNPYSAGAIIAAPSLDGTTPSTVNISGGKIYYNKVGWDTEDGSHDKALYNDYGATYYGKSGYLSADASGVPDNGKFHPYTVSKYGDGTESFLEQSVQAGDYYPAKDTAIDRRTPGAGAILLLSSNLNMSGGSIESNNGEVGAIGVNGVGAQWYDLYTAAGDLVSWTGDKGASVGLSATPSTLTSTFTMTGGTINGNTGISNGGVYVGRYGKMVMGDANNVNKNNDAIVISHNRALSDFGGAGIGLMSQEDFRLLKKEGKASPSNADGAGVEPKLEMYSGTIRENHSVIKGGGIYVATDDANLYGGQILRNKADLIGGGMYVEQYYHTTFQNVVEVTNNSADGTINGTAPTQVSVDDLNSIKNSDSATWNERVHGNGEAWGWESTIWSAGNGYASGGGIWLCPEGESTFEIDKLLVYNNTATEAGDDLYKVVNEKFQNTGIIRLPDTDPLGGKILWLRDGGLNTKNLKDNAGNRRDLPGAIATSVPLYYNWNQYYKVTDSGKVTIYPRVDEPGRKDAITGQEDQHDAIAVKAFYNEETRDASKAYASLKIEGNTSTRGGGIGADGRLAFGTNSTEYFKHSIVIQKEWKEGTLKDDIEIRVYAKISDTEKRLLQTIPLNSGNGYKGIADGIPTKVVGSVAGSEIVLFRLNEENKWEPTDNLLLVEAIKDGDTYVENTDAEKFPYTMSPTIEYKGASKDDQSNDSSKDNPNGVYDIKRTIYNYELNVSNDADKYPVSISKKALTANGAFLSGAKLKIVGGESADGEVVYDNITSGDAASTFQLMEGTYTLVETEAPAGYKLADPITFKVEKVDGSESPKVSIKQGDTFVEQNSVNVTMVDEGNNNVRLLKVDADKETQVLQGAKFTLWMADDSASTTIDGTNVKGRVIVADAETGFDGIIEFDSLGYGKYYLVETQAPKGYQTPNAPIAFSIAEGGITVESGSAKAVAETVKKSAASDSGTAAVDSDGRYEVVNSYGKVEVKDSDSVDTEWSMCINGHRKDPRNSTPNGTYVKYSGVDFRTFKSALDEELNDADRGEFDTNDYRQVQRAFYWLLTDNRDNSANREYVQQVLRYLINERSLEQLSDNAKKSGVLDAIDSGANDAAIDKYLSIDIYYDLGTLGKDDKTERYQNMVTAHLNSEEYVTESVSTIKVSNSTTPSYNLPSAGGTGTMAFLVAGAALVIASIAGALGVTARRRASGSGRHFS